METHDGNKMGRWGATSYLISNMLGSGIFITPVDILNYTNSVGLSLVVWVLSAVISALGAYTYIELGTSIRRSGSDFAYMCYVKWHAIGFMFMASACLFTFPLTLAIQAEAFSAYIIQGLNLSLYSCECSLADIGVSGGIFGHCWRTVVASKLIGFGLVWLLLFLNFFSLKTFVARFQILATVAKLFSATIVILIGFYHFFIKGKTENLQNPFVGSDYKIGSLAGALFSGLFSYDGWDILNFGVEDIAVPQRTMPFAIVFGVSIVALLYVAMNFSYFVVLTVSEFRHSSAIATTFAQETMGSLHYLMSFLISILLLGSLNSTLFAASRCMFAASREGHLPAFLACKNERHDSPRAALFFHVILAITFSFTGNINQLVSYVSFGLWMQRCFTLSALLYIRLKHVPVHPEAIRVPIILSMTFLAISLSLVIVTISENFDTSAIGLSLLVIFAIIYGLLLCEWAPLRNIEWFHNVIDRINYWLCIQAQILFNGLVELGKTEEEQRVVRVSATRRDDEILPLRASSDVSVRASTSANDTADIISHE